MAIKFCFPDIPLRAHTLTYDSGTDELENNSILSLVTPPSRAPIKFSQNTSPVDFEYDLQDDTHACDYVIFEDDIPEGFPTKTTIDVDHSTNGTVWTEADSSTHSSNLYGRSGNLYYKTFTEVSAKQYWRTEVTFSGSYVGASDCAMMHKLFLGTEFSFTSPVNIISKTYGKRHINFKTSSGIEIVTADGYDSINLELQVICSNTEKESFFNKLVYPESYYLFLVDTDDLILDSHKIIYFRLNQAVTTHHKSGNVALNLSLEEVV